MYGQKNLGHTTFVCSQHYNVSGGTRKIKAKGKKEKHTISSSRFLLSNCCRRWRTLPIPMRKLFQAHSSSRSSHYPSPALAPAPAPTDSSYQLKECSKHPASLSLFSLHCWRGWWHRMPHPIRIDGIVALNSTSGTRPCTRTVIYAR